MKYFLKIAITTLLSSLAISTFAAESSAPTPPLTRTEIEKIVRNYLIQHPEVLVEAAQSLQNQQRIEMQQRAQSAVIKEATALFHDPNSPVFGNPQGKVTLVEFFDYQCGHCKHSALILKKLYEQDKNIRFVLKELPVLGPDSLLAAKISLAVAKTAPDKFYTFHNELLATQNPLTEDKVWTVVQKSGLAVNALKKAMNAPEITRQLTDNEKLANALGLVGTPTYIIASHVDAKNPADIRSVYIPGEVKLQRLESAVKEVTAE